MTTRLQSILTLLALVCILILAVFVLGRCSRQDAINEARQNETKAEARTESAVEAITEIGKLNARGQATDAQVRDAQNAIVQADPADRDRVARERLVCLQQPTACNGMQ